MKIETSPVMVLVCFIALRSKSYSFNYQRREEYNTITQKNNTKTKTTYSTKHGIHKQFV